MGDDMLLEYILSSIERSHCKDYAKDVEDTRRRGLSLAETEANLQRTFSQNEIHKAIEKSKQRGPQSGDAAKRPKTSLAELNTAMRVLDVNANKKRSYGKQQSESVCGHCKKPGHLTKECWRVQTCSKCGETGHIARFCPTSKGPASKQESQIR